MIQFMSLKNKVLPPLKFLREFIKMPSNQNFFLEPKLVIIPKCDKISLERHPALIGSFPAANQSLFSFYRHMPHHHTAAPAFYSTLADKVMLHTYFFNLFWVLNGSLELLVHQTTHCPTYFPKYFWKIEEKKKLPHPPL